MSAPTAREIARALDERPLEVCRYLFPKGCKRGNEYEVGNLAGEPGKLLKIHLNGKGTVWSDFDTEDNGGDLLDLWTAAKCNGDKSAAMREAAAWLGLDMPPTGRRTARRRRTAGPNSNTDDDFEILQPVLDDAPLAPDHPQLGPPTVVYDYHDADGNLLGQVCRWDTDDGKQIRPRTLQRNGKSVTCRWQGFPKPRPLYGLLDLKARPDAPVLIHEGEKAAEAGREHLPEYVNVTWPGGAKAVKDADWTPCAGRRVVTSTSSLW